MFLVLGVARMNGTPRVHMKEPPMAASVKVGDKVSWTSSGGKSTGEVVKKQTSPTKIKTHKVSASKDNPEFIVQSEKSGKKAAHKASALKKV